jgi:hypothetical protein
MPQPVTFLSKPDGRKDVEFAINDEPVRFAGGPLFVTVVGGDVGDFLRGRHNAWDHRVGFRTDVIRGFGDYA